MKIKVLVLIKKKNKIKYQSKKGLFVYNKTKTSKHWMREKVRGSIEKEILLFFFFVYN